MLEQNCSPKNSHSKNFFLSMILKNISINNISVFASTHRAEPPISLESWNPSLRSKKCQVYWNYLFQVLQPKREEAVKHRIQNLILEPASNLCWKQCEIRTEKKFIAEIAPAPTESPIPKAYLLGCAVPRNHHYTTQKDHLGCTVPTYN